MKKSLKKISSYFDKFRKKTEKIKKDKEQELEKIEEIDNKLDQINKWSKDFLENVSKKYDLTYMLTFWLIWIFVVYLGYVLFNTQELVYLIIAAFIISIAMEAIVDIFQKYLPRILSIVISYLLVIVFLISWFLVIIPFVLAQSADIVKIFIDIANEFHDDLRYRWLDYVISQLPLIPAFVESFLVEQLQNREVLMAIQTTIQQNISQIANLWTAFINNIWSTAVSIVGGFFSGLFQILLVFVLAIFFSAQKESVIKFIGGISGSKDYVTAKIEKLYKKLWFWLKGQFLLSVFIFVTVFLLLNTIALFGIDLPNKFTLALIAWITEFIPIIGPILGAIPAVLLAIVEYWLVGFVVVVIVYTLIQWFENYILVPLVMNQALWVSPLLILIAMLIWGALMWFVGIVLSVPIAVIVNLIFEDIVK